MSLTEVAAATSLDRSLLLGDWRNTNSEGGIDRIVIEPADGARIAVRCYSDSGSAVRDWGSVEAPIFALTINGTDAGAFAAVYDFGFEEVRLQANVKSGVLVVATFNRFRDASGRSNYFNREFFYRIGT